jgi:hypothetical protein
MKRIRIVVTTDPIPSVVDPYSDPHNSALNVVGWDRIRIQEGKKEPQIIKRWILIAIDLKNMDPDTKRSGNRFCSISSMANAPS